MWRNTDVVHFVDWLREYNQAQPPPRRVGFYGLDLYSLHASMDALLRHLDRADPEAARRVRERYACFDRYGRDSQHYGLMTGLRGARHCAEEAIATLVEMQRRSQAARQGRGDAEDAFDAEQNARVVKNAEDYYRTMYWSDVSSWNLRDRHMAQTLAGIEAHLARRARRPKIVVWAHNSHLGDARATEMAWQREELNLGQLVRERHGGDAVLVGFSTHAGSVTAATDWGGPAERKRVLPSRSDSHERLMHATGLPRLLLPLRGDPALAQALQAPRLERAIGVIYRPDTERRSHYFDARLPQQFDALIHIDTTRAVRPLERNAEWRDDEVPETYPQGL
jgi:erythromycin esterase-like protein